MLWNCHFDNLWRTGTVDTGWPEILLDRLVSFLEIRSALSRMPAPLWGPPPFTTLVCPPVAFVARHSLFSSSLSPFYSVLSLSHSHTIPTHTYTHDFLFSTHFFYLPSFFISLVHTISPHYSILSTHSRSVSRSPLPFTRVICILTSTYFMCILAYSRI